MTALIRAERPEDAKQVAELLEQAFPREPVAELVEVLRSGPDYRPELALVAHDDVTDDVLGFVMLTRARLELEPWTPGSELDVLCLSPLAVLPQAQGNGIARALLEHVLGLAERRAEPYVVIEGDPAFYRRYGFVDANGAGVRSPSERIPRGAFQVYPLPALASGERPRGRVRYTDPFWEVVTPGLPRASFTWLDELERHARSIEDAVTAAVSADPGALDRPVPACPGWTVGEVLRHLGVVERVVHAWLSDGRRPRQLETAPADGDLRAWFGQGWRALRDQLAAVSPHSPASTWCPWEETNEWWRRKQVHEHAIHALDVLEALGVEGWSVPEHVALDGIDEVVRLWLGTQLGSDVGGRGDLVRLVAGGGELWTVGLHAHVAEVHQLPTNPDATIRAEADVLYRWLWGRVGDDQVAQNGDPEAVAVLRSALSRVLQ